MSADDASVVRELRAVAGEDQVHQIVHYLYLPNAKVAKKVAKELGTKGYEVEHRLGADGINWLVLARIEVVATEELMVSQRTLMEGYSRKFSGEYDGWEANTESLGGVQ